MDVKYPDVEVELVGQDGNVFNLIGLVTRSLKYEVSRDAAVEFRATAMSCGSYDEVLQLIMRTVTVV